MPATAIKKNKKTALAGGIFYLLDAPWRTNEKIIHANTNCQRSSGKRNTPSCRPPRANHCLINSATHQNNRAQKIPCRCERHEGIKIVYSPVIIHRQACTPADKTKDGHHNVDFKRKQRSIQPRSPICLNSRSTHNFKCCLMFLMASLHARHRYANEN